MNYLENNEINKKGMQVAVLSIDMYKFLEKYKKEYNLSKLILQNGIKIQIHIQECMDVASKKEFIIKMHIIDNYIKRSVKLIETAYNLELINKNQFVEIFELLMDMSYHIDETKIKVGNIGNNNYT